MLSVCSSYELNAFVIPKHRAVEHQVIIFPVAPLFIGECIGRKVKEAIELALVPAQLAC